MAQTMVMNIGGSDPLPELTFWQAQEVSWPANTDHWRFVQIIGGCNNLLETSFLSDFTSLTSVATKAQQEDGKIQQYS